MQHAASTPARVLLIALALAAAADPVRAEAPPPPGANAICPVDGDAALARFAIEHDGRTVYLCCGRCAGTFRQNPDRYLARLADLPRVGEAAHAHGDDNDAPGQEHAHDHVHATEDASPLAAALHWLGHFHVVTVHFPIGLLLTAAIGELLWLATRRRWLRDGVRLCIWGGAIGAVVAAPLGWMLLGGDTELDDWITSTHRWLGTLVFFWAIALVLVTERMRRGRRRWRWAYWIALFGGAGLVGVTGHFGGMIVHGPEYFTW